jgi:signal transduction histidine kinase
MLYSLRVGLLLAMLTVAGVAIITITGFAGFSTRVEFSRYIEYAGALQDERIQEAVLTYWRNETNISPRIRIAPPRSNAVLTVSAEEDGRIYQLPVTVNDLDALPYVPSVLNFETAPDGTVQVRDGDTTVGVLSINPADEMALIPAQIEFVQFVNRSLLLAAGLAGAAAIFLTLYLSRRIIQPIAALTRAAGRMERGDLSQRVQTNTQGEIGELAHAFNSMAETLNRNEDLRRSMVNDIAHELRTPLTNIRGYLEALQDGVVSADPETINLIYEETMSLNNLVQDLQELALAESGQLRYVRHPLSLHSLVDQTLTMLRRDVANRQITLVADVPSNLPPVFADEKRVGQILRNLLNNAVIHTPEHGKIEVSAAARNSEIEISVKDNGEGIDPDHLTRIFERFYRVDPSRSRSTGGAGLGLAIVKQLVEGHGGGVRVESEHGMGSKFIFTLPVYGSNE